MLSVLQIIRRFVSQQLERFLIAIRNCKAVMSTCIIMNNNWKAFHDAHNKKMH